MSPSDFAWWAWLLCGAGLLFGCWISAESSDTNRGGTQIVGAIIAFLTGPVGNHLRSLLGVIRFIKWAWAGA